MKYLLMVTIKSQNPHPSMCRYCHHSTSGWVAVIGTWRRGVFCLSRTLFLSRFCSKSCHLGNRWSPGLIKGVEKTHQEQFYWAAPYHFLITTSSSLKHSAHTAQTFRYQIKSDSQGNNPIKTLTSNIFIHCHWQTHKLNINVISCVCVCVCLSKVGGKPTFSFVFYGTG